MARPGHMRRLHRVLREYACSYCGAQPGQACRTAKGAKVQTEHKPRYLRAVQDGRFPLPVDRYEP